MFIWKHKRQENVEDKNNRGFRVDQKQDPNVCILHKNQFQYKDICRVKVNEQGKVYHDNSNEKKVGVIMLTLDRPKFRARKLVRHKKGAL